MAEQNEEDPLKAGLAMFTGLLGNIVDNLIDKNVLNINEFEKMEKDLTSVVKSAKGIMNAFTQKSHQTYEILKNTIDKKIDSDSEEEECTVVKEKAAESQTMASCSTVPLVIKTPENHNEVTVCSTDHYQKLKTEMEGEIYPIMEKSIRKRQALLICNFKFDHLHERLGAEHDVLGMTKLLQDLGYNVNLKENLTAQEMESELRIFAGLTDHWLSDSTFLVFMSHGIWDGICGTRHEMQNPDVLAINTIFQTFNNHNCPSLRGKPKVIIIQACRGEGIGLIWVKDKEYSTDHGQSFQGHREFNFSCDSIRLEHVEKDFIAFCSTTPHNISWRHDKEGSIFIKQLIECFQQFAHCWHLEEIFRKVRKAFETPEKNSQMPTVERLSLTRQFYLFPGI
ncbi:caspase-13-like [Macrotis lagotis]|uniref:caspase-13-like n=1 Tax=Macrotis lagotis TaxID=92651 RepID=UPI003D68AB50